jgi:WhiB family redox-sensing transcriptional regulator
VRSLRWQDDAECAESGPEFFFPDEDNRTAGNYTAARVICGRCPVKVQCLEYALANDERSGMYGGLTPAERKRLVSAA